jgi:hypothetical protein
MLKLNDLGDQCMAQCPSCKSNNTVVTEEVYTRKGRSYYKFWQTIIVIASLWFGFATNQVILGILLAIGAAILVSVFSLINAGKRASSKTKITCLDCKAKTYL